ncbi:DUF1330 domain-containing protein [Paraburkholderia sp. XV]|uniref:DUF1330 domain-containing protein n=1 Tax=Paraburkholderia sp. XV TaxID=2831520 RepID=UPI001CD56A74|nr:DUF1330 domain-containing protein [Paraburkholderia sp. XV]
MSKKSYWVIAHHKIYDAEKLAAYSSIAGPAVQAAGGQFLVRGPAATREDIGDSQRTIVVEFESLETAVGL